MIYHHIALNTILPPLTYAHDTALPLGSRVLVNLRGKPQIGVVWANHVQPEIDVNKILPILKIFDHEPTLPENWRELIDFTARYYHYPIGQTVFTALPSLLKEPRPIESPESPVFYTLNDLGKQQTPPPKNHAKKLQLWQALFSGCLIGSQKTV